MVALIVATAYAWRSAPHVFGGTPPPVIPTAVVSIGDVEPTIRLAGSFAALNSVSLLAPRVRGSRSGRNRGGDSSGSRGGSDFNLVLLNLAKPGSRIKAGDLAAQFDPESQLQRLDDYTDSVVQMDNSIRSLLANLAAVKEAHNQSVRAAKAAMEQARLTLKTAPVRSAIDAEKDKLTAEETEATYKELQGESSLVEESQRSQIRVSELNRDQSKIELQRAETNVQRMTVKAPISGLVVMGTIIRNGEAGQIREGDEVHAGQPFMSIVDPSSMILSASVNQVDAEKVHLGMPCTVHVDAYPDLSLPGVVTGIGAMVTRSAFRGQWVGEIPVRIKISQSDSRLLPDLSGSADIVLNRVMDTAVVPVTAVFHEDGEPFVWLKTDDGWVKREVDLGLSSADEVAINSGLRKGDVVALQDPAEL